MRPGRAGGESIIDNDDMLTAESDKRVSISLNCFREYVEKMHVDGDRGFELEFEVQSFECLCE